MKDIVIVANYCEFPSEKGNSRFTYLADLLVDRGFQVEIVTSAFSHKTKKARQLPISDLRYQTTFIDEPGYSRNISLKRLYSSERMSRNVMKYLNERKRPDLIYYPFPPISIGKRIAKYAAQHDIPFVVDIQDLWPEAFRMVFNIPFISDGLYYPFERNANKIYKQADALIAVSETYLSRGMSVNRKDKKGTTVFLGTDLRRFDSYVKAKEQVALKQEGIRVAYIGTLGSSYDINLVSKAVYLLKKKGIHNLQFIVIGDGPKRKSFEDYAKELNIKVEFTGMLTYEEMVKELTNCDIAVNPIVKGAAQSVINKVGDYAAAGLPVLNTQENEEYRKIVENRGIGINCKTGDAEDLANQLEKLCYDSERRAVMGRNNRVFAEERFDRKYTYLDIVKVIEELTKSQVSDKGKVKER
ncbi:glycosyltransferase WbuB [Halobacillus fulvus]|nr:glycosyltransferase WbuB [Halobacillus fulvus]